MVSAAPGELIRVGYTLHLKSDYAGVDENKEQILNATCFPNPSTNDVTVKFVLRNNSDVKFNVVDVSGRLVYESDEINYPIGEHFVKLPSDSWTKGMYFINIKANETSKTIKFIKR